MAFLPTSLRVALKRWRSLPFIGAAVWNFPTCNRSNKNLCALPDSLRCCASRQALLQIAGKREQFWK